MGDRDVVKVRDEQLLRCRTAIKAAETELLAIPGHSGQYHPWLNLWMMFSGAWHSLHRARVRLLLAPFTEKDLARLHTLCHRFLSGDGKLPRLRSDIWSLGHFLISAEHQIADITDRTPVLFQWPGRCQRFVYQRYQTLNGMACPHGDGKCGSLWLGDAKQILDDLPADWDAEQPTPHSKCPLVMVWNRVNRLKHKDEVKRNSKAIFEPGVTSEVMSERWDDAVRALEHLATITTVLAVHRHGKVLKPRS
jgi:hypothetical protein